MNNALIFGSECIYPEECKSWISTSEECKAWISLRAFLKRHPTISHERLKISLLKIYSTVLMKLIFRSIILEEYSPPKDNNVVVKKRRSSLQPRRWWKRLYKDLDKWSVSLSEIYWLICILFTGNASIKLLQDGKQKNQKVVGWSRNFFKYFTHIFYLWFLTQNIPYPVSLYLDGHKFHVTGPISDSCGEKYNSFETFRSQKNSWKKSIQ